MGIELNSRKLDCPKKKVSQTLPQMLDLHSTLHSRLLVLYVFKRVSLVGQVLGEMLRGGRDMRSSR